MGSHSVYDDGQLGDFYLQDRNLHINEIKSHIDVDF